MGKRIVFINTARGGSHGRIAADLADTARAAGYETAFAYGRGPSSPERVGGVIDGAAHLAATRLLDAHGFASARATRALVKRLKADPPGLIHLHNAHGYYLNVEILFEYIKASGAPVVWTLHDCWAFTGHCSHFVSAHCARWRDGCHNCPLRREYPASLLLDRSWSNYTRKLYAFSRVANLRLVTPSRWLAGLVRQSFLKDYPVEVIPNGVDLNVFSPSEGKEINARPMVLAVASPFDHRKGFGDTVSVAQSIPEADTVMVGLTSKQIRGLPKNSNIRGVQRTESRDELVALYRKADVLINTTREDTYPTINMEAMACGTPVAAYDTGGCAEQLSEDTGTLVRVGDTLGMVEAVRGLIARPRGETRGACRARAVSVFDRTDAMGRYVDLYNQLVGK
ncbi:MAG: glycosyltransferase [Oscillospiraceae bacterium]|nr:glycosyltransferase [Oscillospiraceae bacterium]